jgi:hypothetical protein
MPGEFRANIHLGTASVINVTMEEKHSDKSGKAMDLKVAVLISFVLQKDLYCLK